MLTTVLGLALAVTLAVLGLWHVYWAFGGQAARAVVIPHADGRPAIAPSVSATLLVAGALMTASLVILGHAGWLGGVAPRRSFRWATLAIAVAFLLRAIGEFRLIGFFKRVHNTGFAYWDTRLFSPLCLVVSVIAFLLVWQER